MLIDPLVSLMRLVGAGVASMVCWVEVTITTDVVALLSSISMLTVVRCVAGGVGVMACWVECTTTGVVALTL